MIVWATRKRRLGFRTSPRGYLASITMLALIPLMAGCASERTEPHKQPKPAATTATPAQKVEEERPLTQAEIAALQSMLAGSGYDPGPVDGKMGPKTARAIAHYQQDSGLKPTGLATTSLLSHLKSQPDTAPEVVAVEAAIPEGLYPVESRFIYSGTEIHTVTAIKGARIYWETNLGDHFVTGPHFGLPEQEWQSGTWRGVSRSTLSPETTWPPPQGLDVYFDVTTEEWNEADGKDAKRYVSDATWSCRNDGPEVVKVPAGAFETQEIICERSPAPAGAWQKRIWYYVPTVGHFVRRHDFDGAGLEIAELDLISILPGFGSRSLQKGLEGAIHDALDRLAPGEATLWRNPVGSERYLIKIGGGFDGPGGNPCRTYSIAKQNVLPKHEYPALACKGTGKRRWVTPGLD